MGRCSVNYYKDTFALYGVSAETAKKWNLCYEELGILNDIISSIKKGEVLRNGFLVNKYHIDWNWLAKYLNNLIEKGLIEREVRTGRSVIRSFRLTDKVLEIISQN